MFTALIIGAARTIELALVGWAVGFPVGFLLAILSQYSRGLRVALSALAIGIVVIPSLAVLFWLHYPLQNVLNVVWPPTVTTLILLCAYVAVVSGDILGSEMSRLEREFIEPALMLGLSQRDFAFRVLLLGALENGI